MIEHAGTAGVLAIVVLLLVKEFIRNRNGKHEVECPIVEAGGTPLTKEQHDAVCVEKLGRVDDNLEHLKEGQAEVKGDIKKILRKIGEP